MPLNSKKLGDQLQFLGPRELPTLDGEPPWSRELVQHVTTWNRQYVEERLAALPGRELCAKFKSVRSVLDMFDRAASRILVGIENFHYEVHSRNLYWRSRESDRKHLEALLQEQLYMFTSCAMTLVDHTRDLERVVAFAGYETKKDQHFANNPEHRFIQELRVDVVHISFHKPGWKLVGGGEDLKETKFFLWKSQLLRSPKYHPLAKNYLDGCGDGINVGNLVTTYRRNVASFHLWLNQATPENILRQIVEFEEMSKAYRSISSRIWWNVILAQVIIAGKRDPYAYLQQYLTKRELDEISALPHRSKTQIDRIIECVDDTGACDDALRRLVYQAFDVSGR